METPLNLSTLARHFTDEKAAWLLVESMRWPYGPECPHCGEIGHAYLLKPRNGQRTTAKGTVSYRRWWKCAACRRQFSVLVGSIFENSKVPLSKWLIAVYLMCASKNGVAANELRRTLGVSQRTAWHMNHRIREAMKLAPLADMLRGVIVADETWIGGEPKNRHGGDHHNRNRSAGRTYELIIPGVRRPKTDKTSVLSIASADTGEMRSRVVADITGPTLRKAIAEQVDMANSHLRTDEGAQYLQMGREFISHETVNHSEGEYVRGNVSTNRAEGYFGQLKRSLDGTHHHISKEHLPRYLAEHDFRYSTCNISDSARMQRLMGQTGGRRLTYRGLVDY
jgi:transposase-like protein